MKTRWELYLDKDNPHRHWFPLGEKGKYFGEKFEQILAYYQLWHVHGRGDKEIWCPVTSGRLDVRITCEVCGARAPSDLQRKWYKINKFMNRIR